LGIKQITAERVRVCADAFDRTDMAFRNLAIVLIDACTPTVAEAKPDIKLRQC